STSSRLLSIMRRSRPTLSDPSRRSAEPPSVAPRLLLDGDVIKRHCDQPVGWFLGYTGNRVVRQLPVLGQMQYGMGSSFMKQPLTFDVHEKNVPKQVIDQALAETKYTPYWLDTAQRPAATSGLHGHIETDLLVVGGGYTGLWTALQAKECDPQRDVVLIEGQRIGWAASGRNGGFCEYSLVHGESNGENHLPEENVRLTELGMQNLAEFRETVSRYTMDVDLETAGALVVATEPHQVAWLGD